MKPSIYRSTSFAFFLFNLLFSQHLFAQGNNFIVISGKITDESTREPIPGVNVLIKGTVNGIATGSNGEFDIKTKANFPLTLVVSSIGFKTQEFEVKGTDSRISIALVTQTQLGQEVVITASRVEESILKSPVAIEKLDIRAIRESPAPTFYDALENVKGVQMITSSLTFKVPNTRGFNIPNNFRFMQLVDGVDMQAATLGVPLGNAIGPTELDIASVEITPGAASALYGMNAINGMSNLITKDPFLYQGLSIYQRTGLNHVDGTDADPSMLSETAFRYARAFNNRFAFKINGSYMRGTDWRSNTRLDQNNNSLNSANPGFPALNGAANVAFDGWNKYGDDAMAGSNLVSNVTGLTIDGKPNQTLRVARTGYYEVDLVNPKVDNLKFDAALHYRFNDHLVLSYSYRIGKMDGVFQRGNKIQLDNVVVQNHKLELKGGNFLLRGYASLENTGDSYNVKPLADNIDLYGDGTGTNGNSAWGNKYRNALNAYAVNNGGALTSANLAEATQFARQTADTGRALPGTSAFNELKNTIRKINNWDFYNEKTLPNAPKTGGAALIQKSRMYNLEGQWDLSKKVQIFDLLLGADARVYDVIPDGNNFVDFKRPIDQRSIPLTDGSFGDDVYYKKFGGFAQVTKTFFEERLKLFGSLRVDYNPEFDPRMTPRLAAVYTVADKHNFRFTFQQGYRFPALFEALSFVNNGTVKRVGSLSYINDGLGYLENSYTQASIVNFNAAVSSQGNTDAAALANRALLKPADLPKARPEKINSFEVGYKSILLDNKLVVDIDAYSNTYEGFLGQVQVSVPQGTTLGSDASVLAMLDRNRDGAVAGSGNAGSEGQARYRVYTNAKNSYRNYGSSLGITYNFYQKYTVAGNGSFNKMKSNGSSDIFVTGFNTPKWSTNLSLGNRSIIKNVGFSVVYKWQDSFLWESPLVTGNIAAINTFDAQISIKLPKVKTSVKTGATNIFNKRYIQYAGGPTIGGLYYVALTLDGLLNK